MIASANVSEIVERREYLRRIVAVTSMLGTQGHDGHDEGIDSTNREFPCMHGAFEGI